MRRIDPRRLDVAPDERLCVACVRNEGLRIRYFLAYHRRLGIDRFFVIDNGSTDGTTDILLSEPDVHVFSTAEPYSAGRQGVKWFNAVLESHAVGHWTLIADADELIAWPACEDADLDCLVAFLEHRNEDGVLAFLLDMYGDGPIRDTVYAPGTPFLDVCPCSDRDSYVWDRAHERYGAVPLWGGPRRRVFWSGGRVTRPPPFLPKIPFVKWRRDLAYSKSTHELDGVRLSALTAVLLHFKFFSDFVVRVPEEVRRGEHWEEGAEYAVYEAGLRDRPDLRLMYEGSARYESSRQLVALGLMRLPPGLLSSDRF